MRSGTGLLVIVAFCLCECILQQQSNIFCEFEAAILSIQWVLLICLAAWFAAFLFFDFRLNDLLLAGLLFGALVYHMGSTATSRQCDVLVLLFGPSLGKGAKFLLVKGKCKKETTSNDQGSTLECQSGTIYFLMGLILLLAFSTAWYLDTSNNVLTHSIRWTGIWGNPNNYGILMGAGLSLAVGLCAAMKGEGRRKKKESGKLKVESGRRKSKALWRSAADSWKLAILLIAAFMMGVGLLFSFSRGAWVGTAGGLLYLAKYYGKFKWQWVLPPVLIIVAGVWFFWNNTSDNASWYVKRLDLSRGSVQHRLGAWRAGFQIMLDHPFGVGWNNTIEIYRKDYSPSAPDAAPAITTNDYLMLGTQLGWPGLICFVAYAALCFKTKPPQTSGTRWPTLACRAGALTMLIAFWFDGGLFTLATTSVFWILLELGKIDLSVAASTGNFSAN